MKEFILANWKWGITIVIAILIIVFLIVTKRKYHKHNWKVLDSIILENKPRLIKTCEKCNVAIHVPVYTLKQLKMIDEEL